MGVDGCFCWGGCVKGFLLGWLWMGVFVWMGVNKCFFWDGCGWVLLLGGGGCGWVFLLE